MLKVTYEIPKLEECDPRIISGLSCAKNKDDISALCDDYGYPDVFDTVFALLQQKGLAPNPDWIVDWLYDDFYEQFDNDCMNDYANSFLEAKNQLDFNCKTNVNDEKETTARETVGKEE